MSMSFRLVDPRVFLPCVAAFCLVGGTGCSGGSEFGKLVPVTGTVTLEGQPLTGGVVTFVPDASRENTWEVAPIGMIDEQGTYNLVTGGKTGATMEGAPLGWYKVTVSTMVPPKGAVTPEAASAPSPMKVNARYATPSSTDLSLEVVEGAAPGTYDLKLDP